MRTTTFQTWVPPTSGKAALVIDTGVAWCALNVTPNIERLLSNAREYERALTATARTASRTIVVAGVDAAESLAATPGMSDADLARRCMALRGEPWSQARARRDMRERVRIWRRLEEGRTTVPSCMDELFSLWDEANSGEAPIYCDAETARLRTRVPFAHGENPFEHATLDPGYETIEVQDVPREVHKLLAFLAREGIPAELHAAAALFALWHVHPFADGNGHVGRMLVCSMLAGSYSTTTLLAFVKAMQTKRVIISATIAELFLELLVEAQLW